MAPDPLSAQGSAVEIPVQNLPTGPVVFMSGGIGLRYVEAAEVERLREVLATAVEELSRDREGSTWTGSLTELDDLAADFIEAAKAVLSR